MKKTRPKPEIIEACPNCGWIYSSKDYTSTNPFFWSGHGAVSGIAKCLRCGYVGMPILVDKKDYLKIEFSNKSVERAGMRNSGWFVVLRWVGFLSMFAMIATAACFMVNDFFRLTGLGDNSRNACYIILALVAIIIIAHMLIRKKNSE